MRFAKRLPQNIAAYDTNTIQSTRTIPQLFTKIMQSLSYSPNVNCQYQQLLNAILKSRLSSVA